MEETGLWPRCCPSGTGSQAGHSSLALVAGLSNVQIRPGARVQPQDRTIKSKMRKRPAAESKEPPSLERNQRAYFNSVTETANDVLSETGINSRIESWNRQWEQSLKTAQHSGCPALNSRPLPGCDPLKISS